ncbi:hypothetical protein DFJ43DRAFT_1035484 [Lentinula guzmanii]|uniref:Uncharacterized protein n=1 Tax=Lentinula guzmanii TaxID=2804957 RepID=A0AA38JTV7_9AGAR|nr:hypothetical protein DFJ43DRAFT_1035484 [Lentinula guzmanii]
MEILSELKLKHGKMQVLFLKKKVSLNRMGSVPHVVLGMMHNVLEGHLVFHLRELWGLGRTEKKEKQLFQEEAELEGDENFSEIDTEEALSELEDLAEELREWNQSSSGSAEDFNN